VAAVGVPEPRNDHAVVMACFARDCMDRVDYVLREMELRLGPDTSDLGMRFGTSLVVVDVTVAVAVIMSSVFSVSLRMSAYSIHSTREHPLSISSKCSYWCVCTISHPSPFVLLFTNAGIHSGPVTAGVIRGDRARFQLFGDTMNTTARIETTGMKGRIHLSEQTASLIMAAGREEWVEARKDVVTAKGKGRMNTYWLKTKEEGRFFCAEDTKSESGRTTKLMDSVDFVQVAKDVKKRTRSSVVDNARSSIDGVVPVARDRRTQRLIDWNSDILLGFLRQIVARRKATRRNQSSQSTLTAMATNIGKGLLVIDELTDVIVMPEFDERGAQVQGSKAEVPSVVIEQLHEYVSVIAMMYRDLPFHNFEHASHVAMSVNKLLSRVVAPQIDEAEISPENSKELIMHDHSLGIISDPLTQFTIILAALIHDIDHRGVSNTQLAMEERVLAAAYRRKCIAEQNSVDLAWNTLLAEHFDQLRACIFSDISELRRFRQLLVNCVLATDMFDDELNDSRRKRLEIAFQEHSTEEPNTIISRKATVVIEYLIQASNIAHTMQHWHVYRKWNERLFEEMQRAYATKREQDNPSTIWYDKELSFFDNCVIPVAKTLRECGVFGVSSNEYLSYAVENRKKWVDEGTECVERMRALYEKDAEGLEGDEEPER
jgi:3'5'-cyclic nucleotide phosphodiesterase/Adenylate and Guanylate cyclase catalytic domain